MITDEQLNEYRLQGIRIRVVRDANVRNDVKGLVVAWDDEFVLVRKGNRKVIKLPRSYKMLPVDADREDPVE